MKPNLKLIDNILEMQDTLELLLTDEDLSDAIDCIFEKMQDCLDDGGKIIIAGNGGSAADAQHFAAELVVKQSKIRKALAALALTTDSSVVTAIGNDFGYEQVFSRQLEALAHSNDLFIGISTSGNSLNMVEAFEWCKDNGIDSVLLTGDSDSKCREIASYVISIPNKKTSCIQQGHQLIYHTLVDLLEEEL